MHSPTLAAACSLVLLAGLAACGGGATLSLAPTTVEVGVNASLALPDQGVTLSFQGVSPAGCSNAEACGPAPAVLLTVRKDGGSVAPLALPLTGTGAPAEVDGLRVGLIGLQGEGAGASAVLSVQTLP